MTCIVAVRDLEAGVSYLAADTLVTDDEGQAPWVSKLKLWHLAPTLAIGFAGDVSLIQFLKHGVNYENTIPDHHGLERPVGWFFHHILTPARKAIKEEEVEGDVSMVVCLGESLLMVGNRWDVFEHEGDFLSVGSGGAYALGFLHGQLGEGLSPLSLAKNAVRCASAYDSTVGPGVQAVEVLHG